MHESTLIIATHPDDEALDCGGTIAKLSEESAQVHIAFLADGIGARDSETQAVQKELRVRRAAAEKATAILGAASVSFDDLPDNQLYSLPLLNTPSDRSADSLTSPDHGHDSPRR